MSVKLLSRGQSCVEVWLLGGCQATELSDHIPHYAGVHTLSLSVHSTFSLVGDYKKLLTMTGTKSCRSIIVGMGKKVRGPV